MPTSHSSILDTDSGVSARSGSPGRPDRSGSRGVLRWVALVAAFAAAPAVLGVSVAAAAAVDVCPTVETAPTHNALDAADDSAIWIHPTDPSLSTLIGTDKTPTGGLNIYDLSGGELLFQNDVRLNNDDIRYNFPLGSERIALLGVTNRLVVGAGTLDFYRVNESDPRLTKVGSFPISKTLATSRGFALYHSPVSGKYYAFVTDSGKTEQYELNGASGRVTGTLVRTLATIPLATEGLVADDELARLYVAEEDIGGIWRFGAEPTDPKTGVKVIRTTEDPDQPGPIQQDVKGITIYYASNGDGYLIAGSQGASSFHIFNRGDNAHVGEFTIGKIGPCNGIDAVNGEDGIDVTNFNLGPKFPQGFFTSTDFTNQGGTNQNHKLVPWGSIANAFNPPLTIDPTFDPRRIGAPGGNGTILPGPSGSVTATPVTIVPPAVTPPKPPTGTVSVRRLAARRIQVRIALSLGSASATQCSALVGALNWARCRIAAGRVSFARVVTPRRATVAVSVRLNGVLAFTRRFTIPRRVGATTLTRVALRVARPRV